MIFSCFLMAVVAFPKATVAYPKSMEGLISYFLLVPELCVRCSRNL